MRESLYLKDDDYRLSFLYGNFTTLTRFTEADLERVVTERLSPLNVSIHATDPEVRAEMLRNRRGATSLRWLRALLDHGIEVHGQIVVCPGVNDGAVLDDTLAGVLDRYPELASLCVVPLGVSRWSNEARMRPHTAGRGRRRGRRRPRLAGRLPLDARPPAGVRRRRVLPAGRPAVPRPPTPTRASPCTRTASAWPAPSSRVPGAGRPSPPACSPGFFAWVDGAPAEGYRAPRLSDAGAGPGRAAAVGPAPRSAVLTGPLGAAVLAPLVAVARPRRRAGGRRSPTSSSAATSA